MDLSDLVSGAEESCPEEWGSYALRVDVPGQGVFNVRAARFDPDEAGVVVLHLEALPTVASPFGQGCSCDWLGEGTPEHTPSPLCRSLRPDGPRDE